MTNDVRKSGIPVLAYAECEESPVLLSLIFRFNEDRATASLLLQSLLSIDGHASKQMFVLQLDADNLKPGKNSLGPANIPLPQSRLDHVSREGNPQIRTLSLTLKKVCIVWSAPSPGPVRPKSEHEAAFNQLADLAKATKLHILFDYNWLHRHHQNVFQTFVDRPQKLTDFPVWRHYKDLYRRGDWSVFTAENAGDDVTTEDEAPVGERPPVYVEGSKRARHVTPTPSSPPPKRLLLSPYPDTHTSPTEKDSSSAPSPKPLHFSATPNPSSPRPPLAALTADLPKSKHPLSYTDLDATGQKPASFAAPGPGQPLSHSQPHLQSVVEQTVSAILPSMLETLIPSLLPRLLAASSPSPAPSLQSLASQISTAPPPPALSALGVSLSEHVTRRIERELSSLHHHTVSHANHLRNAADGQFFEERESERLAFERVAESKFGEFKELVEGCGEAEVEKVEWRVDELGSKVIEKVAKLEQQQGELERETKELRKDKAELRKGKAELRKDEAELRKYKSKLRKYRRRLKKDKSELKKYKKDLRADKQDLRGQKRALQREWEVLQSARPANEPRGHILQGTRAGSAPP